MNVLFPHRCSIFTKGVNNNNINNNKNMGRRKIGVGMYHSSRDQISHTWSLN